MKFRNRDGSHTAYALACGYIQQAFVDPREVQLYHDGYYHVRVFLRSDVFERLAWDSFPTLGEARKSYAKWLRHIKEASC